MSLSGVAGTVAPRAHARIDVCIPSLALHHHVVITDAAIRAAIELTDIWVTDRRRPDKAIDYYKNAWKNALAAN